MIRRKNVGTSTPEFPPGGVRGQRKRLPVPSRNPKVDGISLSPSRARKILQIHRETRKQPHECPERSSVAHRSGLYKLTSWAPRGALCYGHQIERSASSQPQQEIEHSAPRSRSRTVAPASSAAKREITTILTKWPDPQQHWRSGAPPVSPTQGLCSKPGHRSKGHQVSLGRCACRGSSPALGGAPAACCCLFF